MSRGRRGRGRPRRRPARRRSSRAPRRSRRSSSTTRYSVAGSRVSARTRSSPASEAATTWSGWMRRDRSPTGTHGRRFSGVARTAASLTMPTGVPSALTTTRPRAPDSASRRRASASGVSNGTGIARRVSARAESSGILRCTLAAASDCGCAEPDERCQQRALDQVDEFGGVRPPGGSAARGDQHDRRRPPDRTTRPRRCRSPAAPCAFQTAADSTRPPSSGRPGSRLKMPTRGC